MKSTILVLLVTILLSGSTYSQKPEEPLSIINDYDMAMALEDPNIEQIDSLLKLSYRYLFHNQDTCLLVAHRATKWSVTKYANQKIHADALLQLGDAYRIRTELDTAEALYIEGRALYMTLDLEGKAANADTKLGALNKERGDYKEAMDFHLSAMNIWETQKDTQYVFKPYINISEVFYLLDRKDKALEYNARALEIAEIKNYKGVKMVCLSNQSTLQKEMALDFRSKADTLPLQKERLQDSVQLYFNKALKSLEYSLDVAQSGGNKRREAAFLCEKADVLIERGDYIEAIQISKNAIEISEQLGSKYRIMQSHFLLSKAYRKTGLLKKAIANSEKTMSLKRDKSTDLLRSNFNEELYLAYRADNQWKKALGNLEALKLYQDEAKDNERHELVSDLEAKYHNTQKEQQLLAKENNILELEKNNTKITTQRNYLLGGFLGLGTLGLLGFKLNKTRREAKDKKEFAEALIYAQEEERKRIARDLHDGVGQSLLLIQKQLETTTDTAIKNKDLISETLQEVRSISQDLHPFLLEKFGLTAALENVLEKVQQSSDIFVTSDIENVDTQILSDRVTINIYRTIQEALSNIVKHANATAIKVSIEIIEQQIIIKIQDNGVGFDPALAIVSSKSLGLRTMKERISNIGGTISIGKGKPKGTVVEISVPCV